MAMSTDTTGKALQMLELILDFFADDGHWTQGHYRDPRGRHCLVGAVLHFSASHGLPRAPVMSLLEAALPRRQIGLIAFNDRLCRSAAELRSVILRARAVALENAKHERAAAAFECRLLAELYRDRALRRAAKVEAPAGDGYACAAARSLELSDPGELDTAAVPNGSAGDIAGSIAAYFYDLDIRSRGPLSTPQRPFASIDSHAGPCPRPWKNASAEDGGSTSIVQVMAGRA